MAQEGLQIDLTLIPPVLIILVFYIFYIDISYQLLHSEYKSDINQQSFKNS